MNDKYDDYEINIPFDKWIDSLTYNWLREWPVSELIEYYDLYIFRNDIAYPTKFLQFVKNEFNDNHFFYNFVESQYQHIWYDSYNSIKSYLWDDSIRLTHLYNLYIKWYSVEDNTKFIIYIIIKNKWKQMQ